MAHLLIDAWRRMRRSDHCYARPLGFGFHAMVGLLGVGLLVACNAVGLLDGTDRVNFRNQTGKPVTIYWDDGEAEIHFFDLGADSVGGALVDFTGNCVDMTLVARTADGAEVVRHGPPVCDGDDFVIKDRR